jgi:DNA end-binding protein Ku
MAARRSRSRDQDDDQATPARRPLWNGVLGFGLVSIPVALYSASRERGLDLDYLDRRDFAPVGYQRINKASGKPVAWSDIVRGYRLPGSDRYVVLGEADFAIANPLATRTIAIEQFVDPSEVAPAYFDTPYWLKPGARAGKAYALLRESLASTGRIALARVVIRTRSSPCAVLPMGNALLLNTLRFHDAIRPPGDLGLAGSGGGKPSAREIAMARRFVEELSAPWRPDEWRDEYRRDLLKRIRAKARAGKAHEIPGPEEVEGAPVQTAEVVDLMALLKQSLEAPGRSRKAGRSSIKAAKAKAPASRRRAA